MKVRCPFCDFQLDADEDDYGKMFRCVNCRELFKMGDTREEAARSRQAFEEREAEAFGHVPSSQDSGDDKADKTPQSIHQHEASSFVPGDTREKTTKDICEHEERDAEALGHLPSRHESGDNRPDEAPQTVRQREGDSSVRGQRKAGTIERVAFWALVILITSGLHYIIFGRAPSGVRWVLVGTPVAFVIDIFWGYYDR